MEHRVELLERQAVYRVDFGSGKEEEWTARKVFGGEAPSVAAYGLTEWNGRMLFWAYDPDDLAAGAAGRSECHPPGRERDVGFEREGRRVTTRVVSGVNVPGYEGCRRGLYAVGLGGEGGG
eukprot:Sspe_Gene.46522::Locus_23226_Transcript_1_1_Confidence_1.000_Length_362::g.46522::m.46522